MDDTDDDDETNWAQCYQNQHTTCCSKLTGLNARSSPVLSSAIIRQLRQQPQWLFRHHSLHPVIYSICKMPRCLWADWCYKSLGMTATSALQLTRTERQSNVCLWSCCCCSMPCLSPCVYLRLWTSKPRACPPMMTQLMFSSAPKRLPSYYKCSFIFFFSLFYRGRGPFLFFKKFLGLVSPKLQSGMRGRKKIC